MCLALNSAASGTFSEICYKKPQEEFDAGREWMPSDLASGSIVGAARYP